MLAAVRENLKGTLVVVVIVIFIVPMVISGVGTSYISSTSSGDEAKVNGSGISSNDLERAIRVQRNQILQRGNVDPSSPSVSEEVLRGPVLDRLTRRMALITSGENAGMSVSEAEFLRQLSQQPEFLTDGKVDAQKYRYVLSQSGFTPSGYKDLVMGDLIVTQQAMGLLNSAFSTDAEMQQLVELTHQKRSFYSVKLERSMVEESIELTEDDLDRYYSANLTDYRVPEKVKIEFIELSVEDLAKRIEVDEAEVLAQFESETKNFKSEASFEIAHILLEDKATDKASEISEKLSGGADFSKLAADYSDDIATSEDGGFLGVLTPGMFPEAFEQAVYKLAEGEVSEPVETDAGIHFIKAIKKIETEKPAFEDRKQEIQSEIALARAQEDYAVLVDTLGELTFSTDGLTDAAQELGLSVQQSAFFDRNTGSGIADESIIRSASFEEEVFINGHNSNTLTLPGDRTVVLRILDKKEAYTKSLEEVAVVVEANARAEKTNEALASLAEAFIEQAKNPDLVAELAEEKGYAFSQFDMAKRNAVDVDQEALQLAFTASRPSTGLVFNSSPSRDGGYWLVGVSEVVEGELSELTEEELNAFSSQLAGQSANYELSIYEQTVFDSSDVKVN